MDVPENNQYPAVAQADVALQRDEPVADHAAQHGATLQRQRGPHPLPQFLGLVARVCGDDRARLAAVLTGLRRYQAMPPAPLRAALPVVATMGGVTLRDHGGSGPVVVMVPSLINPPTVIDLAPGNSLMAGLAARGLRALSVDWGETESAGLAMLVETRLVPLLRWLGEPVALAGYCLGGTLALAAAALSGPAVSRAALLATPWRFGGYDADAQAGLAHWWAHAGPLAAQLGVVPMDLLQPAFWSLDEAGVVAKYARLAQLPDAEMAAFTALEDWSNGGQPLSLAAGQELAALFAGDAPGRGCWQVGGQAIDAGGLGIPILDIIAGRDRIVPPAAALSTLGIGTPLTLDAGHVGMVVGSRAPALLWDPLAQFLRG